MLFERCEIRSARARPLEADRAHPSPPPLAGERDRVRRRVPPIAEKSAVLIRMPVSFTAFCDRRRETYVRYATARVGCLRTGEEMTQAAFGDLAMRWPEALRSASPAAVSWDLFTDRITARGRERGELHRVLPDLQADALVLRYRVGLPLGQAADLMGLTDTELAGALRAAMRHLAAPSSVYSRHMRGA